MSQPDPRDTDAILGGQNPPPVNAGVLGGLAGVKHRLESHQVADRLRALTDSIEYGDSAIELAVRSLTDKDPEVRKLAKILLRDRLGAAGKESLSECDPTIYFTILNNWNQEDYDREIGITSPVNNAYSIHIDRSSALNRYDLTELEYLLRDPRLAELQALVVRVDRCDLHKYKPYLNREIFSNIFNLLIKSRNNLSSLKALYVGDRRDDRSIEQKQSKLYILDIRPLLNACPNLEYLHIQESKCAHQSIDRLNRPNLKTLIIDSASMVFLC